MPSMDASRRYRNDFHCPDNLTNVFDKLVIPFRSGKSISYFILVQIYRQDRRCPACEPCNTREMCFFHIFRTWIPLSAWHSARHPRVPLACTHVASPCPHVFGVSTRVVLLVDYWGFSGSRITVLRPNYKKTQAVYSRMLSFDPHPKTIALSNTNFANPFHYWWWNYHRGTRCTIRV